MKSLMQGSSIRINRLVLELTSNLKRRDSYRTALLSSPAFVFCGSFGNNGSSYC